MQKLKRQKKNYINLLLRRGTNRPPAMRFYSICTLIGVAIGVMNFQSLMKIKNEQNAQKTTAPAQNDRKSHTLDISRMEAEYLECPKGPDLDINY